MISADLAKRWKACTGRSPTFVSQLIIVQKKTSTDSIISVFSIESKAFFYHYSENVAVWPREEKLTCAHTVFGLVTWINKKENC